VALHWAKFDLSKPCFIIEKMAITIEMIWLMVEKANVRLGVGTQSSGNMNSDNEHGVPKGRHYLGTKDGAEAIVAEIVSSY
jgi:hypothetical protein